MKATIIKLAVLLIGIGSLLVVGSVDAAKSSQVRIVPPRSNSIPKTVHFTLNARSFIDRPAIRTSH